MENRPEQQRNHVWVAGRRVFSQSPLQAGFSILVAGSFVAVPAIVFFTVLLRNALNIPLLDDYDALLDFLNKLICLKSESAKVSYFFASQHNEYKLFFVHGLAWLQFDLCGHADFRMLSAIGNGFVFLLAILLWKMFLPDHKDLAARLAFFIPVSWLLFQLQYWETLDWSMASLANLPVIVFSLGAIYFLVRPTPLAFCGALACFVLAVASLANGFLMVPVGLLILALDRRYERLAIWLLVSAGCLAVYAYRYNVMSSQVVSHHSVFSTFHPLSPAYVIAFIGSAASFPFKAGSLVVGAVLCVFFFLMIRRGYIRRNPVVSYCVLFLLLTAIGVAGIRSDFGLLQALSSRYAMYSALFLIFAWFAIVEVFLQDKPASLLKNGALFIAVGVSVLFSLGVDGLGIIQINSRTRGLVKAMASYEHPTSPESKTGPPPQFSNLNADPATDPLNPHVRPILAESIRLGIYRPPPL